jgi:hypothetical protein
MRAFMSYQTVDKEAAARVAGVLTEFDCTAFMAHEHIEVSEEWRLEILKELEVADLFVPILSAHYYGSVWCMQESGIAAFRRMTIIPLSIDGALPPGFLAHIQSTKIDPVAPEIRDLLPGLRGTRSRATTSVRPRPGSKRRAATLACVAASE